MCDHCGCPRVEPFATLTAEHEVLKDLALAYRAGDPGALSDLDRDLDGSLTHLAPNGRRLFGAVWDHAEAWEFEVFPQLMMAALADDLELMAALADDLERARSRGDAGIARAGTSETV